MQGLVVTVEGHLEHRGPSTSRAHRLGQRAVPVHRRPVEGQLPLVDDLGGQARSRSSHAAQSGRAAAGRPGRAEWGAACRQP